MPINVNGISCTLADGVRESTDTVGTGQYTLRGARTIDEITYRTVVAGIGDGGTSVFTARLGAAWESFIGTVAAGSPDQLTRDQILSSSNGGNAVNWGAGDKDLILNVTAAVMHSLQDQIDTIPVTRTKTTVFTISGTLTTDSDTVFAWVRVVAGGAASGGTQATGAGQHAEGSGGGGGEYAEGFFTAAQLGGSKAVVIGAGGVAASGANGGNGGNTTFGSTLLTALGGIGGGVGGNVSDSGETDGGAGGTGGVGGVFRVPGSRGGTGIVRGGEWQGNNYGGASHLSGSASGNAAAGQAHGGGASGRSLGENNSAAAGANGAPGYCIVVEYLHV